MSHRLMSQHAMESEFLRQRFRKEQRSALLFTASPFAAPLFSQPVPWGQVGQTRTPRGSLLAPLPERQVQVPLTAAQSPRTWLHDAAPQQSPRLSTFNVPNHLSPFYVSAALPQHRTPLYGPAPHINKEDRHVGPAPAYVGTLGFHGNESPRG